MTDRGAAWEGGGSGRFCTRPLLQFREERLPERATLAGYSALIEAYDLQVPLPRTLGAIGEHHRVREEGGWRLLTPRHAPVASLGGHLTFALKWEGIDLAVLKRLFAETGPGPIAEVVEAAPSGSYARRIWFLYEWLTGERLDRPDARAGRYVPVVDPERQFAGVGETATRYRVRNNLPGTPAFCPLVFRTAALEEWIALDLAQRARDIAARVPRDLLARTAAFLLLRDSRSSYAIEGERAPQDRMQRWGRAIGEAGRRPLDLEELLRLQKIVIGDHRFVRLGLRAEGGFVGEQDRETRLPLPVHVSARPEDLEDLLGGLLAFGRGAGAGIDAVVVAAVLAFGFVYMHPLEDGNGRLHRYLIHHVLAERGYHPPGLVFPVSAAILDRIDDYRGVLEGYSQRLLPLVRWEPTALGNVRVLNDTGDFYRYFDATPHAEFLYRCVRQTIERDLPGEADFLRGYDAFCRGVSALLDMPDRTLDLLFRFLRQNGGHLSQRAREREFASLTGEEVHRIEEIFRETLGE